MAGVKGLRIASKVLTELNLAERTAKSSTDRQPAAEMWRRTLLRVPTLFGRLVYVAALRVPASDRYEHPSLTGPLGTAEADRVLRGSHYQVFAEWLELSLEEQKTDLEEFLRDRGAEEQALRYRELPPAAARDVERQLFVTDLETLFALRGFERGPVPQPPAA